MLDSVFEGVSATSVTTESLFICIGVAIVLGIIISLVHKFSSKITNSNFLLTIAILPVLVETVILLINGNLGTSFAVAGAFSLIRFRSMPGTSKEIVSVFWAMTIGLALGMGYVGISIIVTLVVAVLYLVLSKFTIKLMDSENKKLKIVIPENLNYEEVFNDLFEKYTDKCILEKAKTTNMGSMYELTYNISVKHDFKQKEFLDEIRVRNGNMLVMLERQEISEV